MPTTLPALCLVTLVLCNVHGSLEHGIPRRSFLSRRAIDGTRGRKYFDPEDEGAFDSYGSAGGQYDPYQEKTDLADIRRNVPGEPGIDYPAYTTLPQTGFTCEGRSRGYYADEVAGCQVFHVCHDVLVSSFLCPIGSTFSQKLLTCDWWTKVDCSASGKYIDVNRNSYQQDDDEMIRNAYAMISLQSGTDVTKDGLVDPDRTGIVVDYQRSPGGILDYSPVDTTGNDLKTNFEDYPRPVSRDFLPPYQLKGKKLEPSRSYQEKFYPGDKSGSPYEDSPIIRVQKINDPRYEDHQRNKNLQEGYRRPNEFTNQFQPSYAPTVPTVTTTTRRFYSPTVPTTFRPSTLAYNKLDQVIDSSDYYFSHSRTKSFVTPPTRVFSNDDKGEQGLGEGFRKSELAASRKFNRDDDYSRQESYEDDYEDSNSEETRTLGQSRERFQVRVADFSSNRTGPLNGRSPLLGVYRNGGTVDEFETRGSIGLGQALHQSFRGISVQDQNPVNHETKAGETNSRKEEVKQSFKPESADFYRTGEQKQRETTEQRQQKQEETTERYQRNDQRDEKADQGAISGDSNVFVPSTTPSVIESTIKASTSPRDTLSSVLNGPSLRYNETNVNSELSNRKDSVDRVDDGPHTSRPIEFLKPPEKTKFQIKVPDLSEVSSLLIRYSTLDDEPRSGTTELPRLQNTHSDEYVDQPTSFDENLGVTSNYGNAEAFRGSSVQTYPTTVARPLVSPTGSWSPSSSTDPSDIAGPPRDPKDFTGSDETESSNIHQLDHSFNLNSGKTDAEQKTVTNNQSGVQFTISDVAQNPKTTSVDGNTASTSKYVETTLSPDALDSSGITLTVKTFAEHSMPKLNETSTFSVTTSVSIESSELTSRAVTPRSTEESRIKAEEKSDSEKGDIEASTVNAFFKSIRPETLKQIEETIEKNNSPYQVTLTVNKGEDLVPSGEDLISKLVAQHGKETSTLNDKLHQLEVIKSVEPEIHRMSEALEIETTTTKIVDIRDQSHFRNNFSKDESSGFQRKNFNTVSLLQLMSELLKLDRVPRPFSIADTQGAEPRSQSQVEQDAFAAASSRTVAKDVNSNKGLQNEATTWPQNDPTESSTSLPRSKEEILGELAQNFGQPLYGTQRRPNFELSEKEKLVDFETGLPVRPTTKYEGPSSVKTTEPATVQSYRISPEAATSTTTTSTPKTTLTTESAKTVVKTEFLPSIGFSLDTDEGREEYVEAVLGGLIEPQTAESEKKETILKRNVEGETFSKKNETSGKI
ncbi:unnamed protein product [Xylocopa violacea]|uniref:Chitin-binding type-2 domain-containing protein n=1 Tax=Xylocopa violacea TaxID=135666 RepID=A0ABP1NIF8_XYLVO